VTTNTTTTENARLLDAEPEGARLAPPDGPDEDAGREPDAGEAQAVEEAGARAWAEAQRDLPSFFRPALQPKWLALIVPLTAIFLYAVWLNRAEWFRFGSPLLFQPFVPLLALALVWFRRQEVVRRFYELSFLFPEDSPKRRGNAGATVAISVLACVLILVASLVKAPALVIFALILALGAAVYGLFGPFLLRTLWQPLALLVLAIPPLTGFVDRAVFYLRAGTAYLAVLVAQQFDKGAKQQMNANFEPMVHLTSGDLVITEALCGASVVAAVAVLTVWWCLAKRVPALQSILLVAVGGFVAIALNTLRLIVVGLLTGAGTLGVGGLNPWIADLTSLLLIALAFAVVTFATRRVIEQMTRKAPVVEDVEEDDDLEADLEDILRGGTGGDGNGAAPRGGDTNR
jgi:hypothetical protein